MAPGTSEGSLAPFAPASNCSDCFPVTCLAQLVFCLIREINPISLISTGQGREAGGLTLSGRMTIRMETWKEGYTRSFSGRTERPLQEAHLALSVSGTGLGSPHCSSVSRDMVLAVEF